MEKKSVEFIPLGNCKSLIKTTRNFGDLSSNNISIEIDDKIFNIGNYITGSKIAKETFIYNERAVAIIYIKDSIIFISSLFDIENMRFVDSNNIDMLRRFNSYFKVKQKVYSV